MKKQSLVKGSIILGMAGVLTRFLGLFFRWPLIMLIGDQGVGYYQMSYPLYMFFVAMASGVPIAISKIISENNVTGHQKDNFTVVKEAFYFMFIIGFGMSSVLFIFAKPIINFLQWDQKSYYSLLGISLAPVLVSMIMIFRGFFQGFQSMTQSAISQVLEQVGRIVFGVGLAVILLPKGIEYSAGGAAFGAAGGAVFSLVYLYYKYKQVKKEAKITSVKNNHRILNKILLISIPVSLGATVGSIMSLIDSILVPKKLLEAGFSSDQATILFAQLTGKASVIINIPLTLSIALCTSLIPIIAEVYLLRRRRALEEKINLIIKISAVISIPCLFGLFFMAEPIMKFIFPTKYEGVEILRYLSLSIPFIIITQTTTSVLQGVGSYLMPVFNLFIGCIVKILLTIMLVSQEDINIFGAVIATFAGYFVVTVLNAIVIRVKLGIKMRIYDNFIKPSFASVLMIIIVIIFYNYIYKNTLSNSLSCLLSISIGVIIYFVSILILKVFSVQEVQSRLKRKK